MKKNLISIITFLILCIALPLTNTGCSNSTSISDFNLFAPSDDYKLGLQLDSEIRANPAEYPMLNNAQANAYLQSIVDQIIASKQIKYRGIFAYKVQILDTNIINAFATPGGFIYVYKGLLKFADNEATIAGVLAHEIAHAERRHATQRMTKQYGISILASLVLGNNPSALEQIGANLIAGLGLLKNSRDDEYEADEYSFKYLQDTKWYPGAIKYFLEKIQSQQQSKPSDFEEILSTHPLDAKRIAQIDDLIKKANLASPTENNLFSISYQQFKNSLP
ncbi:MAG TPA: M48 family metallopeptidase [Candidatus Kapabacteria bacterium]|jgi:predicted Zn-dependent protease|nr:M48 family metalloprotease [Candidatus Kapabacteria bacterium]HOV92506.1 M48 family metallopeptidase [Candidatus Kapabacteria bacterium]